MSTYLRNIADRMKRSLWLIPFFMTLGALALSVGLNHLDFLLWDKKVPYLGEEWGVSFDGIRSLFISVGAAIITAMTTILSITLLIFTVLAGHYGSYVLRVFKIRVFSKFVIGWFSGVYVYIIYHIFMITIDNEQGFVPQVSLTLGLLFTLSTIILLIIYIHFLVRQIQAGTVVGEVSQELSRWIQTLERWEPGEEGRNKKHLVEEIATIEKELTLDTFGYVQNIDRKELKKIAEENDCVIEVLHKPGDFIVTGEVVCTIYAKGEIEEKILDRIKVCWLLGDKRISVDDIEYNLDILTQLAVRALSPGINDIAIANTCIDFLGESLSQLVKRQFPAKYKFNSEKKLLLITNEFSFEGFIDSVLNPIRQYAKDHCSVSIRLMDMLLQVSKINKSDSYQTVINRHFMAIYDSILEKHQHPIDQESINERYQTFLNSTSSNEVQHQTNDE